MNLTHHIHPDCILTGCAAATRDELLTLQVAAIHKHLKKEGLACPPPEELLQAVEEREKQQSTCLGEGLAVPHARLDGLSALGLSVAILPRPVVFSPDDQREVTLSILVLAPMSNPNLVLKIWSAFIRLLRTPGIREQLVAARTPAEACAFLRGQNLALELSLTARDLMIRPPFQVLPETPLRQVCFLMNKHHEVAAGVTGPDGRLLGELTSDRIFQYGMPEFFTQLQSVSFVRHFNPLEKYFAEEATLTAQALMTPGCAKVRPEATLIEVIFLITVKNHTKVYVTDADGRLLGVIGRMTVLDRAINF